MLEELTTDLNMKKSTIIDNMIKAYYAAEKNRKAESQQLLNDITQMKK